MADRKFIESVCRSTPSTNLCLKTVLADPKSKDADLTGLALIIVYAVKDKGNKIIHQIKTLEKHGRPELRPVLKYCERVYNTAVTVDVKLAVDALTLGNVKFGENGMADVVVESRSCEDTFDQYALKSPMTEINKGMEDIANVARAIIRMLL
ncbi:cell wall / vacuolar inhibitor of fructosidase 1-like [Cynara cardunculus var. scolymus]|nr:cell wall / vacuolar inhibitor of fructosidase 1-like [Cynara cardunculus var. scolymus]